ncbi:serine/threonine protein kinase [Chitiniphilus purpureus]|uniref:Stress response kinase A n=1 Tax=Chitiniphilus purpureus TaxID=2981137 RepID=A0ABY6DQX6_9NEIS|nr:serine/threonine protein kinase [Chitiniphilus sp. CD1]UXY16759.1 serine/threonine protein kinase [Chitiniphilus sp. CD1]
MPVPVAESAPHPYAALTPDLVLDALESVGLVVNGSQFPLNSYENRVYQVGVEDAAPVIAKFYRPGRWSDAQILEEHVFSTLLQEREIPVVAPCVIDGQTLFTHGGFRFALFPRRGGRAPELDDAQTLTWLGRFLGRIHAVGAIEPFAHRPALTPESFGTVPRTFVLEHGFIPAELLPAYESVSAQALEGVAYCYQRAGTVAALRLHGDVHGGNMLWTPDGPHFVDLDDARMGPAVQDLWMLLSGEREDRVRQLADVLAGYEDFCGFDARELHLIEALRTLRLMHYAGWLAQRWDDPAFPHAFPWFNTQRYWQEHILALREQVAAMDEAPLWPA